MGMITVALALVPATSGAAAGVKEVGVTNTTADVPIPLSIFEPTGKDPFFPNSVRLKPKTPVVAVSSQAPVVVERVSKSQYLTLTGISGLADKRLALINNRPFKAGETGEIRIPGGLVKVDCVEIGDKSVVIQVEGETERKELRLRETPAPTGSK